MKGKNLPCGFGSPACLQPKAFQSGKQLFFQALLFLGKIGGTSLLCPGVRGPSQEPPILAFDVTPLAAPGMLPHFSFFLSKSYLSSQVLPLPQSLSPPRPHTTSCTPQVHSACPRLHSLLAKQGHLTLLALWGHWEGRGGEMAGNAAAVCQAPL